MREERTGALVISRPRVLVLRRWAVAAGRFARNKPLGVLGLAIVVSAVFLAIAADFVAPYDPHILSRSTRMQSPSAAHWFGTDVLGRDVLSRVFYGGRVSLYVAAVCVTAASTIGVALGVSSGYVGGKYDLIMQRIIDAIAAMPALILAMALVAVLPSSMNNIILALAVVQTPRITRVVRSAALSIKEAPYVDAAKTIGASSFRIMFRHVAPNTFAPLLIVASAAAGSIIIVESTLSFLGVGVPLRTISWGSMLSGEARRYFASAPWMALGPGFALSLVVFGINMFADALRDVLDPKLRGR